MCKEQKETLFTLAVLEESTAVQQSHAPSHMTRASSNRILATFEIRNIDLSDTLSLQTVCEY